VKSSLALAFISALVVGIGGYLYINSYLHQQRNLDSTFILDVKKGESLTKVGRSLSQKMDVGNVRVFVKVGQLLGYASRIKYGEYEIPQGVTVEEIYKMFTEGRTKKYQFTFVEGSHVYDLASLLSERGFGSREDILSYLKDPSTVSRFLKFKASSLEGYLYPETYHYSKTDKLSDIVSQMLKQFEEVFKTLPPLPAGMTKHQLVTLASIVEKETGAGFERPLISSVFHNRLKKRMRLETDPTVMYGILHETGKEIQNIKKIHLKTPTIYNTYTMRGLPPGPIGNPGREALTASAKPKASQHLFFVSRNDGTHVFTNNYQDHLKAVRNFQLNPKARAGKSWRDLKNMRPKE